MNDFTVKVRETGKDWKPVDTYLVKVDEVRNIKHHVERASMSYFDFSGEVEVSVTFNHGAIQSGRVRPLSYGITPTITNNTMTFKFSGFVFVYRIGKKMEIVEDISIDFYR